MTARELTRLTVRDAGCIKTVSMTADADQLEPFRTVLTGHCYRMLGSVTDAEDAVQETMVRAWQNLDRFEGRAALKTWLYRIATNVCLDALSDRSRRFRPMEEGEAGSPDDQLIARPRNYWIEPIPDARAVPADASPLEKTMLRQSIRLAFVTALQHLPPRQRAALLLTEVLGWSASEVAECVEMTVAAVNSALQRARATLASLNVSRDRDEPEQGLVDRYVDAFHRYDVDTLVSLLREDAVMSMPPYAFWLRGPEAIRGWLDGRGSIRAARGSCPSRRRDRSRLRNITPAGPTAPSFPGASSCSKAWTGGSRRGIRSSIPRRCFPSSASRPASPPIPDR